MKDFMAKQACMIETSFMVAINKGNFLKVMVRAAVMALLAMFLLRVSIRVPNQCSVVGGILNKGGLVFTRLMLNSWATNAQFFHC